MTPAQLALLTTELRSDPEGFGYAALIAAGDDEGIAALLNGPGKAGDVLPPLPYTVQTILLAVGAQGVGELATANLLPLLGLAGPTFDLRQTSVVQMMQALLTGANPQAPLCPHCLAVLPTLAAPTPCTRLEKLLGLRGQYATALDVAQALGRGG